MLVAGRVFGYIAAVGRLSVSLPSAIVLGASFMRFPKAIAKGQSQNDWYFPIGLIKGGNVKQRRAGGYETFPLFGQSRH